MTYLSYNMDIERNYDVNGSSRCVVGAIDIHVHEQGLARKKTGDLNST